MINNIQINDIFCAQLDNFPVFYQVLHISKAGKTATVREINSKIIDIKNGKNIFEPVLNQFISEEMRKKTDHNLIAFYGHTAFYFDSKTISI